MKVLTNIIPTHQISQTMVVEMFLKGFVSPNKAVAMTSRKRATETLCRTPAIQWFDRIRPIVGDTGCACENSARTGPSFANTARRRNDSATVAPAPLRKKPSGSGRS
jgi:hypothetical protein